MNARELLAPLMFRVLLGWNPVRSRTVERLYSVIGGDIAEAQELGQLAPWQRSTARPRDEM